MATIPPTASSAAEPCEPLYTDEWINLAAFGFANERISNMERVAIAKELFRQVADKYEAECRLLTARIDELAVALVVEQAQVAELRDQLEAERDASRITDANLVGDLTLAEDEIKELQSQLDTARAWEPLPNGVYHTDGPEVVEVADERIIVYQGAQGAWANLQQGYALCKLQPATMTAGR